MNEICTEQSFNEGELVFEENSPSREFYIIMEGEVEIQVDPDTIGSGDEKYEPTTIAVLRRGQSFGEVAIVDPGLRSASARCGSKSCKLLVIDRNDFLKLLANDCQIQLTRLKKAPIKVGAFLLPAKPGRFTGLLKS